MAGAAPRVGVLDYGSGNLHSACRAIAAAGAEVVLSADHQELTGCDALVVPGVGAFAACMAGLLGVGGDVGIRGWVDAGRPLLGICVGHQVLFEAGVEHGVRTAGLGLFGGEVDQLRATRLPHMGWNTVRAAAGSRLFDGLEGERFYFVHSYAAHPGDRLPDGALTSTATHEDDTFIAAIEWGPVSATQFHPEKSGSAGGRLLRNWLTVIG